MKLKTIEYDVDLCVVGGGLAGVCAAISAARGGIKVALMQDRPVLGGNASSEIRMWVCGAHGDDNRETGIIEEIMLENYYRNDSLSYTVWDSVVYEKAMLEKNLTLIMNCSCMDAEMDGDTIKSITGLSLTTQTYQKVRAKFFADCSGDSILAPLTGAEFMRGREARSEFNESIEPEVADKKTMGMSCIFQIRETDHPTKYTPPEWAYKYPTDDDIGDREHHIGTNYWWIELGGDKDSIADTEALRDELLKIVFGTWDHIKNYGDHGAENWELDWVGFLPGKRESRRYIGDYIVNQNDVTAEGRFDDIIGYGGWSMDDHFPAGYNYRDGYPTIFHPAPSPWGIPFRSLYSKNISNLFFAGRNISVTHAALSSCRVMATCAILGQAVGSAAAIAVNKDLKIREIDIKELQAQLMDDDCWIPWKKRELSALTKSASSNAPVTLNGIDRPLDGESNCYAGKMGEALEYSFDGVKDIDEIRIVFDSKLGRSYDNMPCHYPLHQPDYRVPDTMIKEYKVIAETPDGEKELVYCKNNYQRLCRHKLGCKASKIKLVPISSWGDSMARVFSVDFE